MRFTKRKKKQFHARLNLVKEYQNKLFYYTQKVREDGVITIEELKAFDLLIAEFNNKLLELKLKQTKKDTNMISEMSKDGDFTLLSEKEKKKIDLDIQLENERKNKKTNIWQRKKEENLV